MKQGPFRALITYILIPLLIAIIAGCSSGSSDTGTGSDANTGTDTTGTVDAPLTSLILDAIPGPIVIVNVGETATLDGGYSTASSDEPLSYKWSFSSIPEGSKARLQNPRSVTPSFTADVRGTYRVQLAVSARGVTSQRTIAIVQAGEPAGPVRHENFSSDCANCHDGEYIVVGTKVADHLATSSLCQACHSTFDFASLSFVDHIEVFGNCSECHNGVKAIGKSVFHQPTTGECNDCHNTRHFLNLEPDGSYDHSNLSRLCTACHNGQIATGMTPTVNDTPPGTHPDTDHECGYCHTTTTFEGAYPDHTGPEVVGKRCDSCHGAATNDAPSDPPAGHPIVNVDCDSCHTIVSFSMPGGVFNHSLVDATVQPCESCHNDSTSINAPSKSSAANHQATNADCGNCHNTETFTDAFQDHTGIVDNCQSCHGITATGKPLSTPFYEHMPTNPNLPGSPNDQDCADCHTTGTFSTGTYDHAGVTNNCTACHDNVISVGILGNHIPTSQDCSVCHNTTTFTGAVFTHAGINTSNCALCHDGNISTGKPRDHLPTSLDCSDCHSTNNFNTFAGITFNHAGIDPNDCASCHTTGIATPKTADHIPAQTECSQCHIDTSVGGFASTLFMSNVHPGLTQGCEGCHSDPYLPTASGNQNVVKASSHLPTNQDCDVCHTNNSFTPSIFDHTGITGNCASCHDGSVNNEAAGAIGMNPGHPATNGQDCGVCHSTAGTFTDAVFDHTGRVDNCAECHGDGATGAITKKNAGHVPTNQDCSLCHIPGTFTTAVFDHTGITGNCASCHDGANAKGTVKDAGHLPTNQDCSVCHNTQAFAGARFDHQGIVDNCASCHDGVIATGKAPTPAHVPTNEDCGICHQITGFKPATFSHTGITDNCSSCHGAGFAQGKPGGHVVTNQDCGICHNTQRFTGAVFDHTGIVDNCQSCHGVTAKGKDNNHVATSLDCYHCHSTATFVGGTWTHDANSAGNCDSCHNNSGGGATGKPSGHLSTNEQCDVCHSTSRWTPDTFSHSRNGNYPGDHRRDPGCTGCHKGSIGGGINSGNYPDKLKYAPYCAGCHAGDFRSESKHIGGKSGTVEQNKDCGRSGCHRVTSSGF